MEKSYVEILREAADFLEEKGFTSNEILSIRVTVDGYHSKTEVDFHLSDINALKKTGGEIVYRKEHECDCNDHVYFYDVQIGNLIFTNLERVKLSEEQIQYKGVTV